MKKLFIQFNFGTQTTSFTFENDSTPDEYQAMLKDLIESKKDCIVYKLDKQKVIVSLNKICSVMVMDADDAIQMEQQVRAAQAAKQLAGAVPPELVEKIRGRSVPPL
jgi:hypothetical protein